MKKHVKNARKKLNILQEEKKVLDQVDKVNRSCDQTKVEAQKRINSIKVKDCDEVYSDSDASDYRLDEIEVEIDNAI